MYYESHDYQEYMTEKITKLPICAPFIETGLGKIVSTLTAIDELICDCLEVGKVLMIMPYRVTDDTQTTGTEEWDHLKHLRVSKISETSGGRIAAPEADTGIYVINCENVTWLVNFMGKEWPFEVIVVDELSSFKSNSTKRFKSLHIVHPLARRFVGLMGIPAPSDLLGLWPQVYLIDRGERLGETYTGHKDRYFLPDRRNGFVIYPWIPKEGAKEAIEQKLSDICTPMKADDYLNLSTQTVNDAYVSMDRHEVRKYRGLERGEPLEPDGKETTALSAAVAWRKLLQLANRAAYDGKGDVIPLHDRKPGALAGISEASGGHPVLVFYNFRRDYDWLVGRFRGYNPRTLKSQQDICDWNEGRILLFLAQSASMGRGLNIQAGGHIIAWFGSGPSLELYLQANARLHRQGQTEVVIIHRLVTKGVMNEDVAKKLWVEGETQDSLMKSLRARIRRMKDGNQIQHPGRGDGDKLRDFLPGGQKIAGT